MNSVQKQEFLEVARDRVADVKRMQEAGLVCKSGDFYASVHYPPITMYSPIAQEELFKTYTVPEDKLFDVYVHLPFCHGRCLFCHYPVQYGDRLDEKDRYLAALENEMDIYMRLLGLDKVQVRSILVGGGTPTYLTPAQLKYFLDFFVKRLDLSRCEQFNYDVDPATMSGPEGEERLRIMRSYGVDRLTIGVQSLDKGILKIMNRPHGLEEIYESIELSQKHGYQVNVEFIFGHPGQTLDNWIEVMEQAVRLGVEEIQMYRLKVEAYGDFQGPIKKYKQIRPEECPPPEEAIMMKQLAISILKQHGYHENIRRVFTKEKKHYSAYAWNQCCELYDEIGFGLTAFSSLRDRFGLNTQHFDEYYRCIEEGRLPVNRGLVRSQDDQIRWSIVLPIKNSEVRSKLFEQRTGVPLRKVFRTKIENLKSFGLVQERPKGDETLLECTERGAFFADQVAQQFHDPKYIPFTTDQYNRGPLYPFDHCGVYD
jgi:oxygen-independent coproporphyrinogen-3 oxidase